MANKSICSVGDCGKLVHYNGLCSAHAEKNRKYGSPHADFRKLRPTCSVDGCEAPHKGRGFCQNHLLRFRRYGDPIWRAARVSDLQCSVSGCGRKQRAGGLCELHYGRKRNTGETGGAELKSRQRGARRIAIMRMLFSLTLAMTAYIGLSPKETGTEF